MATGRRQGDSRNRAIIYALLLLGSFIYLVPFLWMISTSLKPVEQTLKADFDLFPRAYFASVDGTRTRVRPDDKPLDKNGAIVEVLGGPRKGERLIATSDMLSGETVTLEYREADLTLTGAFPCRIEKTVEAGWFKVTERLEAMAEATPRWTVVPGEEISTEIQFEWGNYREATKVIDFFKYAWNSLQVAIFGMIGTTLSCSLVAYGFSRIEWKGRDTFFLITISTMMIPFPVTMIPLYSVFKAFGLIGNLSPLWLPCFFGTAYNIFLLRQFFMSLPRDISEAARIDGCNEFQIFVRIVLPLAKPALIVVALFHFMWAWNDFMGPLIYLTKESLFTLAIGLQAYQSKQGGTEWHFLMAACVLTILPILVLYFMAQKTFIEGISLSGSKD